MMTDSLIKTYKLLYCVHQTVSVLAKINSRNVENRNESSIATTREFLEIASKIMKTIIE